MPLKPAPIQQPVLSPVGGRFTQPWVEWFTNLLSTVNSGNTPASKITTTHVSADTTAVADGRLYLVNAGSGIITITLPPASSSSGCTVMVKKIDSSLNAVIVDGDGTEEIDNSTTLTISNQYDCYTILSDGTEWWVV